MSVVFYCLLKCFKEHTNQALVWREFTPPPHHHVSLTALPRLRQQGGLWLFIPSTGALADPAAVILDCMSTVPEKLSQAVIQGHHRFCYF